MEWREGEHSPREDLTKGCSHRHRKRHDDSSLVKEGSPASRQRHLCAAALTRLHTPLLSAVYCDLLFNDTLLTPALWRHIDFSRLKNFIVKIGTSEKSGLKGFQRGQRSPERKLWKLNHRGISLLWDPQKAITARSLCRNQRIVHEAFFFQRKRRHNAQSK